MVLLRFDPQQISALGKNTFGGLLLLMSEYRQLEGLENGDCVGFWAAERWLLGRVESQLYQYMLRDLLQVVSECRV
jgi:hypothetical protein